MIDRRAVMKAAGALGGLAAGALAAGFARASRNGLMRPERVESYPLAPVRTATIEGGKITYALAGPADGPLVLYFHGWGDDYRVVLPLEYGIADAGFRLVVPHRPGYAGTTLDWIRAGKTLAWRTASDTADVARRLIDQLQGSRRRRVAVIGTSGGAPAALAFAAASGAHAALLIQAGAPGRDRRQNVPSSARETHCLEGFGWAATCEPGHFRALVSCARTPSRRGQGEALAGERLAEAKRRGGRTRRDRRVPGVYRQQAGELNDASTSSLKSGVLRLGQDRAPRCHPRRNDPSCIVHAHDPRLGCSTPSAPLCPRGQSSGSAGGAPNARGDVHFLKRASEYPQRTSCHPERLRLAVTQPWLRKPVLGYASDTNRLVGGSPSSCRAGEARVWVPRMTRINFRVCHVAGRPPEAWLIGSLSELCRLSLLSCFSGRQTTRAASHARRCHTTPGKSPSRRSTRPGLRRSSSSCNPTRCRAKIPVVLAESAGAAQDATPEAVGIIVKFLIAANARIQHGPAI